jgi:FkbM family methyltransferase
VDFEYYHHGVVGCRVRTNQMAEWDKIIVRECQEHYAFKGLDYSKQNIIVDVGANIGAFSLWALAQNPQAEVIAIEVEEDNAALLKLNLAGLGTVYPNRLGYSKGDFELRYLADCGGSTTVIPKGTASIYDQQGKPVLQKPMTAKSITLETILKKHKWTHIDVLKLDCEGAEYDILPGMELETLVNIRHIVGEYHDGVDRFERELLDPLLKEHFEVKRLTKAADWGLFWLKRWGVE